MLSIAEKNSGRNHLEREDEFGYVEYKRCLRSDQVELFSSNVTNLSQFAWACPFLTLKVYILEIPLFLGKMGQLVTPVISWPLVT